MDDWDDDGDFGFEYEDPQDYDDYRDYNGNSRHDMLTDYTSDVYTGSNYTDHNDWEPHSHSHGGYHQHTPDYTHRISDLESGLTLAIAALALAKRDYAEKKISRAELQRKHDKIRRLQSQLAEAKMQSAPQDDDYPWITPLLVTSAVITILLIIFFA